MSNIKSITPVGKHQTFDLEVNHPDHQFYLANGMLTSNSHAVAYAIDSYWCAWLMTHYEEQWLTSYMESMSTTPEKRAKAFAEVKALGYQIVPIDINHATMSWTVLPGKRLMPSMTSVKGVGEAAVEELMSMRPFSSLEELLYNEDGTWRLSKFNRKALEALIKVKAFDDVGCIGEDKLFKTYKHMYETLMGTYVEVVPKKKGSTETVERVRDHAALIKRSTKTDPHEGRKNLYELARALAPSCDVEWSRKELAEFRIEYFGSLDVLSMIDPAILNKLDEKEVISIDDLEQGDAQICWFVIAGAVPKKTKTQKTYMQLHVIGPLGKTHRLNVWGWKSEQTFSLYELCFAEVKRDDYGCSTTSWKLKSLG